ALAMLLPETSDTEFSAERFVEIIDSDMNNNIGNFAHRTLSFAKSVNAAMPGSFGGKSAELRENIDRLIAAYEEHFMHVQIREALHDVLEMSMLGNAYISAMEPWKLNGGAEKGLLNEIVYTALDVVFKIGILLYPFTPRSSAKLLEIFDYMEEPSLERAKKGIGAEAHINKSLIKPIFSKLTEDQIRRLYTFK
ncbi:MAG: class I tRNA ligase family protein, partial [Candidatus Micrarchaeaceae archaeon]